MFPSCTPPRGSRTIFLIAGTAICLLLPARSRAWGAEAQRLVVTQAVGTLPDELRAYFQANRTFLDQHVNDPLGSEKNTPLERRNHTIFLDKYGRFPYDALPRSYKAAVAKYGKSKVEGNGLLPWEIGVYSQKLTEAMKLGHWDEVKLNAAILAYYVAEAHDPFNTTENFDGHLTDQRGINDRFGDTLVERFSSFFPMRPNDATFISDPTEHAFEVCLASHSWVESILLSDRNAHREVKSYSDEYFDRFYNAVAATLIRELSDAASDVGSYWLTAWINAGKPALPH